MSSQVTVNPYPDLGTNYTAGLVAIIQGLGGTTPTITTLVTEVYDYFITVYFPTGVPQPTVQLEEQLKSVAYTAINSYVNGLVPSGKSMLSPRTMGFVNMLIGAPVSQKLPIYLTSWISDVEDNISKAGLTADEQRPLLMATEVGTAAFSYWRQQTLAGSTSPWANFFVLNNNDYNSIPAWVAASMEGVLAGYAANFTGLNDPSVNKETNTMWAALIGALTIAAGKVVFGWIPRIELENLTGGFSSAIIGPNANGGDIAKSNKNCPYSNNCYGGNCSGGCGMPHPHFE